MALTYKIKDFYRNGDKQHVGMTITSENKKILTIDKEVDFVEGKSNEEYINEAYALMRDEVDAWEADVSLVDREFDVESGQFV
tara:strand:+ start:394 stop:642 length:249 start_codon:yes stop_codon:yes gene_type:complete